MTPAALHPLASIGAGALRFGLDETGMVFLVLSAFIWVVSAAYSMVTLPASRRARLLAFFVPAAIGGIGVTLALDAVAFYLCFGLMALSSWGLIAFERTAEASRAARIYLTVTVIGEALLLGALVLASAEAGSTALPALREAAAASANRDLIVGLTLAAFGLKIGVLGASGILPLAYANTPTGAASALAGASAKIGLLGLVRILPIGSVPLESWGSLCMVVGLATAFVAALLGVLTTTPKAVLGYSSASQLGLVLIAVGVGLAAPDAAPVAYGAIAAYALHHSLAKSALFLGEDVACTRSGRSRAVALAGLALPALALAGAPFTSGFLAKHALKEAVHAIEGPLPHLVEALLPWAAVGTAALMVRFLLFVAARPAPDAAEKRDARHPAAAALFTLMLAATAAACWLWPAEWSRAAAADALSGKLLWAGTWPTLLVVAATAAMLATGLTRRLRPLIAPGDLLLATDRAVRLTMPAAPAAIPAEKPAMAAAEAPGGDGPDSLAIAERTLTTWGVAAAVFVTLAIVFALLGR